MEISNSCTMVPRCHRNRGCHSRTTPHTRIHSLSINKWEKWKNFKCCIWGKLCGWNSCTNTHTHTYTLKHQHGISLILYTNTHSQSSIGRSMRRRRNKKFIMAACLFWQTWNHMNYTKFSLAFYSKNKTKSISRLFFLYYLSRRCILWIRRMLKVKMVSMKNPKAVFEWNAIVVYDLLWYFWKSFSFGWKIMNVEKRKKL